VWVFRNRPCYKADHRRESHEELHLAKPGGYGMHVDSRWRGSELGTDR
jgi:hypothetical protein